MSNPNTVAVRYIGSKEVKTDNVSDSGAVWHGNGDVQHVTHAQWGKLSAHKEVWERADVADRPQTDGGMTLGAKSKEGDKAPDSADQQQGEAGQQQAQANDAAPAPAGKATTKKGAK